MTTIKQRKIILTYLGETWQFQGDEIITKIKGLDVVTMTMEFKGEWQLVKPESEENKDGKA